MRALTLILFTTCVMLAIAATVLAFIFILPEKRKKGLPGFLRVLHDLFNFKFLIIEKILQAMYIFSTVFCIFYGLFFIYTGFYTIFYTILGPIVLRVAYEGVLLFILLVKNVIQINNKLKNQNDEEVASMFDIPKFSMKNATPAAPAAPQAQAHTAFCTNCGVPLDANGHCPNCGR